MPEELALQQLPVQAGAVQLHEGVGAAAGLRVDPPGQGALAGACLPIQKDGDIHPQDLLDPDLQGLDGGARTRKGVEGLLPCQAVLGQAVLAQARLIHEAPAEGQQSPGLHGLHQEVIGPLLDEVHRQRHRRQAGDDHHRRAGLLGAQLPDQLQGIAIRQLVVQQDDVGLEAQQGAPGLGKAARRQGLAGLVLKDGAQQLPLDRVILHDQQAVAIHQEPRSSILSRIRP